MLNSSLESCLLVVHDNMLHCKNSLDAETLIQRIFNAWEFYATVTIRHHPGPHNNCSTVLVDCSWSLSSPSWSIEPRSSSSLYSFVKTTIIWRCDFPQIIFWFSLLKHLHYKCMETVDSSFSCAATAKPYCVILWRVRWTQFVIHPCFKCKIIGRDCKCVPRVALFHCDFSSLWLLRVQPMTVCNLDLHLTALICFPFQVQGTRLRKYW